MTIKISLVDNDFVVRAKTDLEPHGKDDPFGRFFMEIGEELVTGKTAYLEIEGSESGPLTLEVSKLE